MKKIAICLLLMISSLGYSQTKESPKVVTSSVSSLKFSVNSIEEFDAINWNDVKEIIRENDSETNFSLEIELTTTKSNTKKTIGNVNVKVNDVSKNYESLIGRAKKAVEIIKKMFNK